jgi:hypothetical protein
MSVWPVAPGLAINPLTEHFVGLAGWNLAMVAMLTLHG